MRRANGTVLHGQLPGFLGPARACRWRSTRICVVESCASMHLLLTLGCLCRD